MLQKVTTSQETQSGLYRGEDHLEREGHEKQQGRTSVPGDLDIFDPLFWSDISRQQHSFVFLFCLGVALARKERIGKEPRRPAAGQVMAILACRTSVTSRLDIR